MAAAVVLVVAEFSLVSYRTIGIGACDDQIGVHIGDCRTIGHHAHAYSLLILGLVGLVMAVGAVLGRSRPACWATAGIGVAVLFIALALDAPKLDDSYGLETHFNKVRAHTGDGFRLELLGGVLLLLVGGLGLGRLREEEEEAPLAAVEEPSPEPEGESEAAAARPETYRPRTTARAKERERSRRRQRQRQRRPRKPEGEAD